MLRLMDVDAPALVMVAVSTLAIFCFAILVFFGAVWFGMRAIAPRLRRALDRAETEDDIEP
jgi:hypothetical protein